MFDRLSQWWLSFRCRMIQDDIDAINAEIEWLGNKARYLEYLNARLQVEMVTMR